MKAEELQRQLAKARATVRVLEEELAETNRGLVALMMELEQRVEERTGELRAAHAELKKTNSDLLQLTLELEDRVNERTAELSKVNDSLRAEINERKRTEEKLSHLAAIVESSEDAIMSKDLAERILSWNKGAERIYGYTADEIVGQPVSMLVPPDRPNELPQIMARLKRGESVEHFETIRVRKGGRPIHVSLSIAPLKDATGKVVGASAIARDIAKRREAEEALWRASLYHRSLIEASLDPLVTIGPDGKITDVNAATEAATGRSRAELIGTDFCDYFTEPERARAGYQRVFREGSVRDYALELRHRHGRLTPVLYNASVYRDVNGTVIGLFAAARDITERKRAEEQIEHYLHELERSNRELENFAYVSSHDLQEPLRTVANFSQLLAERYQGRLDADAHDFIQFIVEGATRMQTLINDLLAFSRVGTRGKPFVPVACEAVLKAALDNLEAALAESGATVTHDPLPQLEADATQLAQLFQNLLANAIKYRRPEVPPRIHITAQRWEAGAAATVPSAAIDNQKSKIENQKSGWLFSVRDNGIGIESQYFERIFIIFQRLHGRTEYPGTGIGLALCRKIVERHSGRIWVNSEFGQGSTFYFTLPDHKPEL